MDASLPHGMRRVHTDECWYNTTNKFLLYLGAEMLFLFLPRHPPAQNAQTDSTNQLGQIPHTKHNGNWLFGNLLKETRLEL